MLVHTCVMDSDTPSQPRNRPWGDIGPCQCFNVFLEIWHWIRRTMPNKRELRRWCIRAKESLPRCLRSVPGITLVLTRFSQLLKLCSSTRTCRSSRFPILPLFDLAIPFGALLAPLFLRCCELRYQLLQHYLAICPIEAEQDRRLNPCIRNSSQ